MSLRYRRIMSSYRKAELPLGWWNLDGLITPANCIAAYQPKGATSYAASKINLANPGTYDATEGNVLNWSAANGWSQANSSDGLDTGIVAGEFYTIIARLANYDYTATGNYAWLLGASLYNCGWFCMLLHSGNYLHYYYGKWSEHYSYAKTTGIGTDFVVALAANNAYYNGSLEQAMTDGTWASTTTTLKIFGNLYVSGYWVAGAIYNTVLNANQVSSLTTAMNAL